MVGSPVHRAVPGAFLRRQAPDMDVVEVLERSAGAAQGLMTARQLAAAGVDSWELTRAVRTGRVLRVRRAVYAAAALPKWPRWVVTADGPHRDHVLHVRAALLMLGSSATASGRTAAALRGWGMLVEPVRTIEVCLPHAHGSTTASRVTITRRRSVVREELPVADADGLWVTTSVETVVDLALSRPLIEAVVVCDSALRARDVTLEQLRRRVGRLRGRREARRLQQVLDLCDPESGSVLESVLRVRMLQAGIVGFASQRVIRDAGGGHVLRVDFCFERARLVVEVDGSRWHPDGRLDRRKDNALACAGWRVLRFTWSEVVDGHEAVLAQIRAALALDCTRYGVQTPAAA